MQNLSFDFLDLNALVGKSEKEQKWYHPFKVSMQSKVDYSNLIQQQYEIIFDGNIQIVFDSMQYLYCMYSLYAEYKEMLSYQKKSTF